MTDLAKHVYKFLVERHTDLRPLLLGLSGGPDSLALFYLLLDCQKKIPFKLGIAHVDHNWRTESRKEALQLEKLAAEHGLPFHIKTLDPGKFKGNLEANFREERIAFFTELTQTHNYRAVLLAHHRGDYAETVLKNVFEGANLNACNGISEEVKIGLLTVWRPLLSVPKKTLLALVKERQLVPFDDETNRDTKYLRARLRQEMIPALEGMFGKGIESTLASFGRDCEELHDFLSSHLKGTLENIRSGPMGTYIDFSQCSPLTPFEIKFLIRSLCQKEGCRPSRDIIERASASLLAGAANKCFEMGNRQIFVDRKRLFVSNSTTLGSFQKSVIALHGAQIGCWKVALEDFGYKTTDRHTDWQNLWEGMGIAYLPLSSTPYQLGPPLMNHPFPRTSPLSKWWNKHKIPAFLRHSVPVVWSEGKIVHEFLTGKPLPEQVQTGSCKKLTLGIQVQVTGSGKERAASN